MTDSEPTIRSRITGAIRHYLDVLDGKNAPQLADLAKALDGLVAVYYVSPDVGPESSEMPEAPRVDEQRIMESATAVFPDLGWYALVDPQDLENEKVGMSIAVGDLAEIASDLLQILWLFENAGHDDAVWEFRFGYQTHWGRHLHELRNYLHALSAY